MKNLNEPQKREVIDGLVNSQLSGVFASVAANLIEQNRYEEFLSYTLGAYDYILTTPHTNIADSVLIRQLREKVKLHTEIRKR